MNKPVPKWEKWIIAGSVMIIIVSAAAIALAGDREGVGGLAATHDVNGNPTNHSLRQDGGGWFTDFNGRSVFSWDYLSQPGSGIGTYTDYDGIPGGGDEGCCEAGIGSWGNGGGTGAGARGY